VEDKLEESPSTQNHISFLNMHKMGFTNLNNCWIAEVDGVVARTHDGEADPRDNNQKDVEPTTAKPMEFVP